MLRIILAKRLRHSPAYGYNLTVDEVHEWTIDKLRSSSPYFLCEQALRHRAAALGRLLWAMPR